MYTLKYKTHYNTVETLRLQIGMYECDKSLAVQAFSQSKENA